MRWGAGGGGMVAGDEADPPGGEQLDCPVGPGGRGDVNRAPGAHSGCVRGVVEPVGEVEGERGHDDEREDDEAGGHAGTIGPPARPRRPPAGLFADCLLRRANARQARRSGPVSTVVQERARTTLNLPERRYLDVRAAAARTGSPHPTDLRQLCSVIRYRSTP